MSLKFLYLIIGFFFISIFQPVENFSQSIDFLATNDLYRIFDDGDFPSSSDTIKNFGINGEIISAQCFIHAKTDIANVTLELNSLKNETGDEIPLSSMEWNFVGSVPLESNAPNQSEDIVSRKAPALFPDYLMQESELEEIRKGSYQGIWLTIAIPENAEAGKYGGNVVVKTRQGDRNLPISITVFPITLPEERNLLVSEWYTTRHFPAVHGIDEIYSEDWFHMLGEYAKNMVAHRQNVFQVPFSSIGISKNRADEFEFDFTRFDQIAEVFWNTGKMDYLETGELFRFGEQGWNGSEILPKDYSIKDEKSGGTISVNGYQMLPILLPAFEDHLRQKGWLDKTLFHVKDEPSLHNASAWTVASRYVNQHAPDLIRIDAIETPFVLKDIEVAVPKLDALASWFPHYDKARKEGGELWLYTVGIYQGARLPNKTIDMPLIDSRLIHWMNYKYDASGYLHWGWNIWTSDPYNNVGMHLGDGWHVYPAKDGVLNSLRWEQMRNGIQDYECFKLFENKIQNLKDSLGARFSWIDPSQRPKEICSMVVSDFLDFSRDPEILYQAKRQLIEEILDLEASPKIYIQTNPVEGISTTVRSSVEVYGWVEPATDIKINNQTFPVSDQGLFVGKILLSKEMPDIIVSATNDKGSKEIARKFYVK